MSSADSKLTGLGCPEVTSASDGDFLYIVPASGGSHRITKANLLAGTGGGVSSFNGRTGAVSPISGDYSVGQVAGAAPLASPTFTGVPAGPTATVGTNTTQFATTAFVLANAPAAPVTSVFGRTGAVVKASGDYAVGDVTGAAPIASPTFTGVPAAPTATLGTNTTQLATCAFVLANAPTGVTGSGTTNAIPLWSGSTALGNSLLSQSGGNVTLASGQLLVPNGTVAGPSLKFASGGGIFSTGSGDSSLQITTGSNSCIYLGALQVIIPAGNYYAFGVSADPSFGSDVRLYRDAPGILAQRNGANAQVKRVYETWLDASNGSWLAIKGVTGADFVVTPEQIGTPTLRGMCLGASGGKIAFNGATAVVKPTTSGSRGGNAALASLLTTLATLGLIVDGSSA